MEDKVLEYEQYIGVLPPITINQDDILIDGFHRYYAYKNKDQNEIEVTVINTQNDNDLFLKAIEMNSSHGLALSMREKRKHVVNLYKKLLDDGNCGFNIKRLKKVFSIPDSTFSDWTKDLNDELEAQRLEKILDLYLKAELTYDEIANLIGLTKSSISNKLTEMIDFFSKCSEITDSEISNKYQFLYEKYQNCSIFIPFLYNIWNTPRIENEYKHFGNFPIEFMENLLYYYTKPFDIVYDPFAGGGVTIDVCKKWLRKYYCSDAYPIELRKDIIKWKIQDGLPNNLPIPDFVFLDPPYWRQAEGKYSKDKNDLANMGLKEFYDTIEIFIKELKKRMKQGFIALVIQPTQYKNNMEFEDHIIKFIQIFEKHGFKEEMRYILPYSTQQYNAQQVEKAKQEKICLTIIRDLIIFRRNNNL
jgi:DNA modification methylase